MRMIQIGNIIAHSTELPKRAMKNHNKHKIDRSFLPV